MKKTSLLITVITIILFMLPFFWLKPGEMDLGGDSSRLYFYDPGDYLQSVILYGYAPTDKGGETTVAYALLPYITLLFLIKKFINSPTFLISLNNGVNVSVAFLFVYLTVKEFLRVEGIGKDFKITIAAILAGLVYVFAPYNTYGWDRVIFTRNQIFLNPLMFYLLFKYFIDQKKIYILMFLILTFIFSFNFSYFGAPPFFAFYPLSLLFLSLYTKYIVKKTVPIKGLLIIGVIFLFLQSFHLIPSIWGILSPGSLLRQDIVGDKTVFSAGLDYFLAVSPSLKVSTSFFNLAQSQNNALHLLFVIYPITIIFGLLLSKKKTIFLISFFFLIFMFFATANITNVGYSFYRYLFYIPGFRMFRSVDGQWGFVFLFFYCILLGLAWGIIFNRLKNTFVYIFSIYVVCFLIISALYFIQGNTIRRILYPTKGVSPVIRMDPVYEKALNYIGNIQPDVKLLSFPLADGGYQLIQGVNGGAYFGPPIDSYIRGRNDFTGYDSLYPFNDKFINAVYNKNISSLTSVLSYLNIGYVFYNSDTYIYNDAFSNYPYGYVTNYMPVNQEGYKKFIEKLPLDLDKKIDFGEKYHLYPIKKDIIIPHIYSTTNDIYSSNPAHSLFSPEIDGLFPSVIYNVSDFRDSKDTLILEADPISPFLGIKNNYHLHKHYPFISRSINSSLYPVIVLKEQINLLRKKKIYDVFLDYSLYVLSKRILEINESGGMTPILKKSIKPPSVLEFYNPYRYSSWEASLARYESGMNTVIANLNNSNMPQNLVGKYKIIINEQLLQHQLKLIQIINGLTASESDKKYLNNYSDHMFARIAKILDLKDADPSIIHYHLELPVNTNGDEYQVIMESQNDAFDSSYQKYIEIGGNKLIANANNDANKENFGSIRINNRNIDFTLHAQLKNLMGDSQWESSGKADTATSSSVLITQNNFGDNSGGLIKKIDGWLPNRQYLISFEYNTEGNNFIFKLNQRVGEQENVNTFFDKNLNSTSWKSHQSVIASDLKSKDAYLQFLPGINNRDMHNMHIRNLKVVEVVNPRISFIRRTLQKKAATPKIVFTMINPTKYLIKVSNVTSPYTLVFLDSFGSNWRLRNPHKQDNIIWKLLIEKFFGAIGSLVEKASQTGEKKDKIIASYFEGNVLETKHTNVFLDSHTFDTIGKQVVAGDRHFLVNGYANAWYINPKDLDGKTNYELILELKTQNIFYVGLFISLVAFLSCIFTLIMDLFKRKYYNK